MFLVLAQLALQLLRKTLQLVGLLGGQEYSLGLQVSLLTRPRCLSGARVGLLDLEWGPSVLGLTLPVSWALAKALQRFEGQLIL